MYPFWMDKPKVENIYYCYDDNNNLINKSSTTGKAFIYYYEDNILYKIEVRDINKPCFLDIISVEYEYNKNGFHKIERFIKNDSTTEKRYDINDRIVGICMYKSDNKQMVYYECIFEYDIFGNRFKKCINDTLKFKYSEV